MQELYQDLGYQQKKVGWKFGVFFFTIIAIYLILFGISCVASIPIFVGEKIETFIKSVGMRINNLHRYIFYSRSH